LEVREHTGGTPLCCSVAFRVLRGCRPTTSIGRTPRPERCPLQSQRESVDGGCILFPDDPSLKDIQTKFEHDFAGVASNGAHGFAFFVNQPMTIGERELLQAKAGAVPVEIYHLERIPILTGFTQRVRDSGSSIYGFNSGDSC
jgi:hypothetical protein